MKRERERSTHLINCEQLPFDIPELLGVPQSELVGRQQDVHPELFMGETKLVRTNNFTSCGGSDISDNVHIWSPGLKLCLPGGDGGERNNNEERTILLHLMEEIGNERYCLHGLSYV